VQSYLERIQAYDKDGPALNAIITINPNALPEADRLDAAFKASGFIGPLHGVPIIMKDQGDATPMPTTLGSVLFRNYYPERDAFVVDQLKKAGAIILAKATLGELGGGDTHGSLFGSTKNPYDLERTAGGSSGGSGASVAANFCTVAVGQEGFASIRRPSTWNCIAGMRPTAGLVSRSGVYAGWPSVNGSLGPMARSVTDLAKLLDVMAGYDPDDPVTARGVGRVGGAFTEFLDANGLKGARIGILRESMGYDAEPASEDFKKIEKNTGEKKYQRGPTNCPKGNKARPDALWGPQLASVPLLLLYKVIFPKKNYREDFRDKAPPSRGGTWAGAILLSDGAIPPGILPSGRGKSKPSTSPMILSLWEDQSSSTSSPAPSHLKP
jgi:Asp-tRNA(Asn)/Glu-tRNA(Gln) amidotransferase A subunit family amidase